MTAPLQGKTALVTGASRGIGRAVARALAHAGADVAVTSTSEGGTAKLEAELRELGRKVVGVRADLSRREDAEALLAKAVDALGPIDLLVNNAGVLHRAKLRDTADADWDRVLEVNLTAPFRLARALLPSMLKRGFGRVVNISSISGTLGTAGMSAYCASKWGINGWTKALAQEVGGTGIHVFAVLPGSVDTEMLKATGFPPLMKPEDVAGVVRYLCTEAPAAMSGSLVEVFG